MVKDAVSAFPVFSFMAIRFALAAAALTPMVLLRRSRVSTGDKSLGVWEYGDAHKSALPYAHIKHFSLPPSSAAPSS